MGPRQVPAASHKATILQLDDKTIRQTELTIPAFLLVIYKCFQVYQKDC